MKLYIIDFKEPMDFAKVRAAAKKADNSAIVYINEGSNSKSFEVQSKPAAKAIVDSLGGSFKTLDYDIRDVLKYTPKKDAKELQ